jgi:hypothetical protein
MTPDTTTAGVETALRRAFSITVPVDQRRVIDRRVRVAVAARPTHVRAGTFRRPRRAVLVGAAAAVLLLTATVAAGATLFGSLIRGAPLLEDVWARATVIHQSATNAGYTIVLERAAADRDRIWVAFSVKSESGPPAADWGRMRVTDANGVVMDGGTGVGSGVVHGATASLFGFKVPAGVTPQGPFTLEVMSLVTGSGKDVPGHWAFAFDVPLTPALVRP